MLRDPECKVVVAEEGRSGSGWETISGGKFGKFGTSTRFNVIESSSEILKFPGKKFFFGGRLDALNIGGKWSICIPREESLIKLLKKKKVIHFNNHIRKD